MKATSLDQERLLELQKIDTQILQAEHRRKSLPELVEISRLENQVAELNSEQSQRAVDQSDIKRELAKAEEDVEQVRNRKKKDEARLAAGTGSPKDLENLQHEVATLERRIAELEEVELEVMVRLEEVSGKIAALAEEISTITQEKASLDAVASEKLDEIKRELAKLQGDRADISATIDSELMKLYEKIRSDKGGIGAAEIIRRRCTGCQLDLTAADAARFASTALDEVIRCEECRRILVRTADSGL
jgi:predicted  nucleic acid-binding Zn-ribbon protein